MKKIVFVHRWAGSPNSDFYPWLKEELQKFGIEVFMPDMPKTEEPVIEDWVGYLTNTGINFDEDTFFVGHSIGCQTILRFLEKNDVKVGGAIFVAPWFKLENLESKEVEEIAKPWLETPIDLSLVNSKCKNVKAILSSNEPFGFVSENKNILEQKLNAEVSILENRGHFTEDDGCNNLPEVLILILKAILEGEFANVYEWKDSPDTKYEEHLHKGKVAFYVVDGSVKFFGDLNEETKKYQRLDVPVLTKHSALVGENGCHYVVGEEIEGDS